jgi:hypothetical protein
VKIPPPPKNLSLPFPSNKLNNCLASLIPKLQSVTVILQ